MVETDWREILSFSQRELMQADKEKLCESLSWMEADDIELNFTDLKTLFRLAQDILKFKSEQVNNLLGQLETSQRKSGKTKSKGSPYAESPGRNSDTMLDAITHQEEIIKANKEILEQLHADITELERHKNKLEEDRDNIDKDSDSSRDALSEMEAVAQLENEVTMKNRHIRKLLSDVKVLEEENTKLKEKVSVLKDKLTEATELIENLTEQLFNINNESTRLKEILGKTEQAKAQLSLEIDSLRKELMEKYSSRENIYDEMKSKVQHWKNIAKSKKAEIDELFSENTRLKEDLDRTVPQSSPPGLRQNLAEEIKIKELQEKLSEASNQILQSANLIEILRVENSKLKSVIQETPEHSISDIKNESDDGKERIIINKLKRKIKKLTTALEGAEEITAGREKELAETTSQLQLLRSDEGIDALLQGLKNKKRQLKVQDEGIKSLVQKVNNLNEIVNDLQLENETMRQNLGIPMDEKINTKGLIKTYRDLELRNTQITKELRRTENKLIAAELYNRNLNAKISKMLTICNEMGFSQDQINEIYQNSDNDDVMPADGGGESSTILARQAQKSTKNRIGNTLDTKVDDIIEENEGLRKGLQEILNFLKDNSTTSSGILALECPSLDTILQSMEVRHAAGWFAPHMAAVMELRTALGGKDALLTALHEARKEMLDIMSKLSRESQKSLELEKKLSEMETTNKKQSEKDNNEADVPVFIGEFGTWISDKQENIDISDKSQIESLVTKRNVIHEDQLKNGLIYFHNKFKYLFEKMSNIAIQACDDQNKWSIQEEQYKAQIENLKAQLYQNEDEDRSDVSPGIISIPNISFLQRKCLYLEESYKYIRTINENMKNDYMESKKEAMLNAATYETQIQKLILAVASLTDRLRDSISLALFWKQNKVLNDLTLKYRKSLDQGVKAQKDVIGLYKRLENAKIDIISRLQNEFRSESNSTIKQTNGVLSNIEQTVLSKQLQEVCSELEDKLKYIQTIERKNEELQNSQAILINETLASLTKKDLDLMNEQLKKLIEENKILKEQCQHVESQLDIALLQLQDSQQRQLSYDMEVNMLRHQILDLQSTGDNKAIVARLGGEVLVAHLQATESHKKIERLNSALNKEKLLKFEAEDMLRARQKIFDVYAFRYETKFRYMYEVMQVLRQQYQGSLPISSIENYLNTIEDLSRNTHEVNEKLDEIEDVRSSLMAKHSIFNQILDVSKSKCLEEEDSCPHKLQHIVMEGNLSREIDHCKKKINVLEQSRQDLLSRCYHLEKSLILVNQGFEKSSLDALVERRNSISDGIVHSIELEDVQSDEEPIKRSQTVTLPKPQILKKCNSNVDITKTHNEDDTEHLVGSPIRVPQTNHPPEVVSVFVQTNSLDTHKKFKLVQTEEDQEIYELKHEIDCLKKDIVEKNKEMADAMKLAQNHTEELIALNKDKINLNSTIQRLEESNSQKDKTNEILRTAVDDLRKQIEERRYNQIEERMKFQTSAYEENKSLMETLKQLENEKNRIVGEYKELLNKERKNFSKSVKDLQLKIDRLQTQVDRKDSDSSNADALKETINKYTLKIGELEQKCFKSQSDFDGCKAEMMTYQSELARWKDLASERLTKMEQLNSQLEERHCHEVESYKAENEHWMSQLNETQREHIALRSRLTEQKALYVKQLTEKDALIEQLRSIIHGLKTQIMNMQTMISVTDPSFDLSAIVEVEEVSDALSQLGSDRLELKFDSAVDLHDMQDDTRMSATSTSIWQEPVIERLRREKQLTGKQNAILRRQIKALAARERRARLDAQNLKSQVYRISTSGSKAATAETVSLHNKIAQLQAQLTSARRDTHSTVALWDKWKRAQQAAERWQTRYEQKCQDERKAESSLNLAKITIARLEKEKRVLLAKLTEVKNDRLVVFEKQDGERAEKSLALSECARVEDVPPVSARALIDRVQAQQRRIVALEAAEKGNEYLVSEYEKALAEVTSLKGQVLKLESTLLESQIRTPMKTSQEQKPEVDYWKNYCDMLKEENVQLTLKVNSMETAPATAHQHRVNDLEQTVLTLRGLVSKLQAEQKSSTVYKRPDSRPSSGRSGSTEKGRNQLESYRLEIANLKRSILDKDLLLEKSKEMLKIAAEREDHLLRENATLRHRLDELTQARGGFLSA